MPDRSVAWEGAAKLTLEGAGVRLKRGIDASVADRFDPFLLFDDFSSDIPAHYLAGFPWHPHRGIETVTYILDGAVRHRDSLGNEGSIGAGSVQWMTAGSGIIHEEMPESAHGIRGFQLWVNLPRAGKMAPPRYQDLTGATIPAIALGREASVRIIAGALEGVTGALEAIAGNPLYLDIAITQNGTVHVPIPAGHTAFAYVVEGAIGMPREEAVYPADRILLFTRDGTHVSLAAGARGARILLIAGAPLREPIAWRGPIVMNTEQELLEAFRDLREGSFIKHRPDG